MNRVVPLILAVALFMEQMDSTVIATALPAIAADLHVGPITLKLALTSYMVALAIFIPVSGWMADRFGAKRIFRLAIMVFVLGSVLCAVSSSLFAFVGARFLQGMGGAMMTPVGRLVLLRTTKRSDLVSAMALLTIPALVGPLSGPPIGGFITTYFSWHWIFLINVPIGFLGVWLATVYLPEVPATNPPPVDVKGFFYCALATAGIVFGLSVVSLPALPPIIGVAATVSGIIGAILFVHHARRHKAPLINLDLFQNRTFRAASIGGTIFRVSTGAIPFLMPLMLQLGFGLTPFQSGLITFTGAIGAITTKFAAKRVFAAVGFRRMLIAAPLFAAATTLPSAFFTPETSYILISTILLMAGFARSFFFTGVNALSYSDIGDDQASQATSVGSVLQQVGLALGVAVAAAILEASTLISGAPLDLSDFHVAFAIVTGLSMLAAVPFLTLSPNAGAAVSGHGVAKAHEEMPVK
ncbi:DHA2 family efflux MFS transporter permease subunit [Agrobacterium sp. a22-2]|uniref:DHA2 family efflux MFS transporter permease subunit n=1 Tax=Agrobacterium sp. a22-2 TaxID=2283840 RepID=UPI0014475004|nr:DHA2 family efflux MFS transporter permease subunit [Agrobacterium sp. a22-2]NKN38632.1 DHA2 family efflux MFS transporter permease subunit [Agrobacterium sp. a22-2]